MQTYFESMPYDIQRAIYNEVYKKEIVKDKVQVYKEQYEERGEEIKHLKERNHTLRGEIETNKDIIFDLAKENQKQDIEIKKVIDRNDYLRIEYGLPCSKTIIQSLIINNKKVDEYRTRSY